MERIFQKFDLDPDFIALAKSELDRDRRKLEEKFSEELKNLSQTTKILRQGLLNKGYVVLESNDVYCGLHGSIILGGELGKMQHKTDFYELTTKLKLPYVSGPCYFELKLKQLAETTQGRKESSDNKT